jgi:nondiscriminating glutamyl-tRNA synthetase
MSDANPVADPATTLLRQPRLDPADPRVELALELFRDGHRTLAELADEVAAVLRWEPQSPLEAPWGRRALGATRASVLDVPELDVESAAVALERAARTTGLGRRALEHAVPLVLTGRSRGPELPRLIAVLGRDEVVRRLDHALDGRGRWR